LPQGLRVRQPRQRPTRLPVDPDRRQLPRRLRGRQPV